MKIRLLITGKNEKGRFEESIRDYCDRVGKYTSFEMNVIDIKKTGTRDIPSIVKSEAAAQLKLIDEGEYLALLDEKGKAYNSEGFAGFLQQKMNESRKSLVFIIGGAYGFASEVYDRADHLVSLSPMTFSHQLVRLVFMEQIYRAFTIIRGEPYHHK